MYNITKLAFFIIVSSYIYFYFKNISKHKILDEYEKKLSNDDNKNKKIRQLSKKLDILAVLAGAIVFAICAFENIFIVIALSIIIFTFVTLYINSITK